MSLFTFDNVKISAMSIVVPENEINIYDEAEYYDNNIKKIDRMRKIVGFHKRRVADNTTTASDLAIQAAENLIRDYNIDKDSIEALVFVVQTPDYTSPATSYFVHQKLGLKKSCIATDINQGCAGWVFGLFMASQMIESKAFSKILLLNGDTPSVGINPKDRNSAPIFGDAGCATLLEYSDKEVKSHYNIETHSDGFEAIISASSGSRFRLNLEDKQDFELFKDLLENKFITKAGNEVGFFYSFLDGMAVFDFTISIVPQNIKELMEYAHVDKESVGALCLHQANKQIVQNVGELSGFSLDKVPYEAFENYGNNTMCSIPTTIALLDKDIDKSNLICSGFGNGLVCASAVFDLSHIERERERDDSYLSQTKLFQNKKTIYRLLDRKNEKLTSKSSIYKDNLENSTTQIEFAFLDLAHTKFSNLKANR